MNDAAARAESGLRQLFANAGWLLLAYVLPRVFTFGAVVVAARILGTHDFGAYGTAAAFAVILSILSTLGMSPMLIREIARAPARAAELLTAAHVVKVVTSIVMLGALWLLAARLHYPPMVLHAAMLLGIGYAIGAFAENYAAYFQALEQMQVWMQASAVFGLLSGLAGTLLVVMTRSMVWFSAAFAVGQAACLIWLVLRSPASARFARVEMRVVTGLLKQLAPFAAAFVALTIYYKVDVLLLARFRSAEDVGEYSAAYKFIDILQALAIVAASAVYPRLARTAPRGAERNGWTGSRVAELMLVATVPVGALLWLVRLPLIHFMYGSAYHGSTLALAFLAPAIPALALNILAGYLFGATGRMELIAVFYVACAAVKLTLDWFLIPRFGAAGAAAAMLIAETILAVSLMSALRVAAGVAIGRGALVAAGCAAAVCATAALVPDRTNGLFQGALYALAISVCYWKLGVLPERDRRALGRVFQPQTVVDTEPTFEGAQ